MQSNTRFGLAVYAVALANLLQRSSTGDRTVTSEQLAEDANRNPVVVRRLLGPLRDAGLLTSQPGPGGGWRLTRPAGEITLRDIYLALEDEPLFAIPASKRDTDCPLGDGFPTRLSACFRAAEEALELHLGQVTLADVMNSASGRQSGNRAPELFDETLLFHDHDLARSNEVAIAGGRQ
jgi:Rrf2 family protein